MIKSSLRYQPIYTTPSLRALQMLEPCLQQLASVQNVDDLNKVFTDFAARFGLSRMGQLLYSHSRRHHWQAIQVEFGIDDLREAYFSEGIVDIDPVIRRALHVNSPLPWGLSEHRKSMTALEKRFYGFHNDLNNYHGLIVPIHAPGYTSMLAMTDGGCEADFLLRMEEMAQILHLFGVFVSETMHRINLLTPVSSPLPSLTRREVECLSWAAEGKTAWEMAQILCVAEATAIFHLENAKKKLNARTLPQAVAIAITHGLML